MFAVSTTAPMGGALSAAGPGSSDLDAGVMSAGGGGGGGATNGSDPLGTASSIAPEFGGGKIGDIVPDGGDPPPSFLESAPSLITLDMNHGTVLLEGHAQIGIPGEAVDLRAQVRIPGGGSPTYSWDTSGLANAVSMSGTATHRLQFEWDAAPTFPPGVNFLTDTATLTVTVGSQSVQQTYTFLLPRQTANPAATAPPTWSNTLDPGLVVADAPMFAGHNVAVSAATGAVETALALPTYSPNFAPLVLQYSSLYADARPIIVGAHELTTTPTQVTVQLTFNGVTGGTSTYDTTDLVSGDIMQVALQANATALTTGRYDYSLAINDGATTTHNGTASVVNGASSPLGAGWSLGGLHRLTEHSNGVLIDVGQGDSLWFAYSGGTYASPSGDFSTLTKNQNGSFTRNLRDGSRFEFEANGRLTSVVDRNNNAITYAYDTQNRLISISDPYSQVTTLAYGTGGLLASITDPANRVTTFTHTGTKLTAATLPLSTSWSFAYDTAGKLTSVTDPRSKITSMTYDGAGRTSTSTRPDSTTKSFTAWQTAGFVVGASAVAATLRAEATARHTNARGHASHARLDWDGLGLINQATDPLGHLATANLDADGLAKATVDPLNRLTQTSHDALGNPEKVLHEDLAQELYDFDTMSLVASHTDARGYKVDYLRDTNGNLLGYVYPELLWVANSYTGTGRLATSADTFNNTTTYAYDTLDRLISVTSPANGVVSFTYDNYGNVLTVTRPLGQITSSAYDSMNRVTSFTDPLSQTTTLTYDAAGNLTSVAGPMSRVTSLTYDHLNRPVTLVDPIHQGTTLKWGFSYDAVGNLTSVTDPLLNVRAATYDARDLPLVVRDALNQPTTRAYDAAGQLSSVTNALGHATTFAYDARGRLASSTRPGALTTTFAYDANGNRTSVTDPLGHVRSATFDTWNRLASTTVYPDGVAPLTTTYSYDWDSNLVRVTDPLIHSTEYTYDNLDNLMTVVRPAGGGTTTYDYDELSRPTSLTDPVGNVTTWAYDLANRIVSETGPNLQTATYAYDAVGNLTSAVDRLGRVREFTYDANDRRTSELWRPNVGGPVIRTMTPTFDDLGRMTGLTDPAATYTWTYDAEGRLTSEDNLGTPGMPWVVFTSSYDAVGNRTGLTDNFYGVRAYTYNARNWLTRITESGTGVGPKRVDFAYDNAGRRTSLTRFADLAGTQLVMTTLYAHDQADRLTSLTHNDAGGATLASYAYTLDAASRLAQETRTWKTASVPDTDTLDYSYTNDDQLIGVTHTKSLFTNETYSYDANGNRTMSGYVTGVGNRLTSDGVYSYTHDNEGNVTVKTVIATGDQTLYSWDHRNRVVQVDALPSGGSLTTLASFRYDALDRRIRVEDTSGVRWTAYDGIEPTLDFDGAGVLTARRLHGPIVDEVLARETASGTAWYLGDRLGTVRDVVDNAGTQVSQTFYDSYGQVVAQFGTGGDRFQYTGREWDSAIDLQYNRARYYDPAAGRWTAEDPIGFGAGDANLYRYVGNNVFDKKDPFGLSDRPLEMKATAGGVSLKQPVPPRTSSHGPSDNNAGGVLILAGTAAAADGPIPVGDIIAGGLLIWALIE